MGHKVRIERRLEGLGETVGQELDWREDFVTQDAVYAEGKPKVGRKREREDA